MARSIQLSRDSELDLGAIVNLVEGGVVVDSVRTEVAYEAIDFLLGGFSFDTVLDVGSGRGEHAKVFRFMGKEVTTLDPVYAADIEADFLETELPQYDVVWCSHVLEHQRNIGLFLDKMVSSCKQNGLICISVPPEISPYFLLCHPNQFSAGHLLYHLIMAGVDCREAFVLTYGYNVSVVVQNRPNGLPKQAWAHELECAKFFPDAVGKNGNQLFGPVHSIRWESVLGIEPHFNAHLS